MAGPNEVYRDEWEKSFITKGYLDAVVSPNGGFRYLKESCLREYGRMYWTRETSLKWDIQHIVPLICLVLRIAAAPNKRAIRENFAEGNWKVVAFAIWEVVAWLALLLQWKTLQRQSFRARFSLCLLNLSIVIADSVTSSYSTGSKLGQEIDTLNIVALTLKAIADVFVTTVSLWVVVKDGRYYSREDGFWTLVWSSIPPENALWKSLPDDEKIWALNRLEEMVVDRIRLTFPIHAARSSSSPPAHYLSGSIY